MANTKAENAVLFMGLEKRFIVDSVVQLNLISNNPEDAYNILENDFDLVTTINLRTGKEITFEVGWSEVESVVMISNPNEEEIYIDMLQESKSGIWMADSPTFNRRLLFGLDRYEVYECETVDGKRYYLLNKLANQTYEMWLETCFELVSRYLDEDHSYILLLDDIKLLEKQAVVN